MGIIFVRTDGLPGPVIVKKFGKPFVARPRYVSGPFIHLSFKAILFLPIILILFKAPVIASNPVANIIISKFTSPMPSISIPSLRIKLIGFFFKLISSTFPRLNVSK